MSASERIHVSFHTALSLAGRYVRIKFLQQLRSVAFIILYLVAFKMLIFREAPDPLIRITAGIVMVTFGLTIFLEGLLIGLMPLGERVGLRLPRRYGLAVIMSFGLLLGIGVTLAEPAIAALRGVGQSVTAWDNPLLFAILEQYQGGLVAAVAIGVGIAVAVGMLRFHLGLSLKPFIYTAIPASLLISVYCAHNAALAPILGLAWDTGAITTGPVTVPLVLALGIGVSRASTRNRQAGGGFGVIMLASVMPVVTVLLFGIALARTIPAPVTEEEFFSPAGREHALSFFKDADGIKQHAFQRAGEKSRRSVCGSDDDYRTAILSLRDAESRRVLLGSIHLDDWLQRIASPGEQRLLATAASADNITGREQVDQPDDKSGDIFRQESFKAFKAVVPLAVLLLAVLLLALRSRPVYWDETMFGIVMALIGIALLTAGIRIGLAPLGDQVGRPLPRMFRSESREEGRMMLEPFDPGMVQTSIAPDGTLHRFFYLSSDRGIPEPVPFVPERFDPDTGRYEHVVSSHPIFGPQMTALGICLVLLFAFGLGYGSTLAEPALNALGRTVEEISAGTIRASGVVLSVSIGVGIGLIAGVCRILYHIPMLWMLLPPYLAVLLMTHWSEEDFASVAWDSGGVTTGVVTVPLVMAMGLGIGSELGVADGFGVLSMASVYPVLTVLLYGIIQRERQRQAMRAMEKEQENG